MDLVTPSGRRRVEDDLARHGGDVYAVARRLRKDVSDFIDFSSNTHVFAAHVTRSLINGTPYPFEHYPDNDAAVLREVIAAHENCSPANVLPGNGSSELIWLALRELAPRKILFLGPMFSEYVRCAMLLGIEHAIVTPPDGQDFACGPKELRAIWDSNADLAVLCTPNNPGAVTYRNIQELFEVLRIPRVLVDNTYREFLHGWPEYEANTHAAYTRYARTGVSVFSMNSFTKFFACPGLRLGYLVGDATTLSRMAKHRPPWMLSPFAEIMGLLFLEHIGVYRDALHPMRRQGEAMALHLRRNGCFDPDRVFLGASFITAALAHGVPASVAREKLLHRGVIVRDCDTIPGMPKGYLRMQIRPQADSRVLLDILDWHGERGW
ncbi:Aminotransferase class I and II [uncultured delta proteobacterium]|uniref:Aminotransferase class I and II n=1 Tax=uncultured delta proteobacterium TaxID=34034 RepID=A0A212KD20_9DELT|nr:Aminotransferase class I and II [uncultured delta proteobacterium]